jgi:hypothetical protein
VDRRAQVKGLQATAPDVAVGEFLTHLIEDGLQVTNRAPFHQAARIFQGLADFFTTRHFAKAGVARAIGQDDDVAREKRTMSALEVHQHVVTACDRNHAHRFNNRYAHRYSVVITHPLGLA